jgi:urease accessory protein
VALAPTPARAPASGSLPDGRHLQARAHLAVDVVGGRTRVIECWGEPPLLPRQTPEGITLVGSAAGPMGGDRLSMVVEVGARAHLSVDSVAATYARPGPGEAVSQAEIVARVGTAGRLTWVPEPLVAVEGCHHRAESVIDLEVGAELFWVDVVVLGRHHEGGGEVWARRSVDLGGRPLNRQSLHLGPGALAPDPAVLGGARVVASCLVIDPEWADDREDGPAPSHPQAHSGSTRAGVLALAGPAVEVVGLGQSLGAVLDAWALLAGRLAGRVPNTARSLAAYVANQR